MGKLEARTAEALRLLAEARPAANVLPTERQQWLREAVEWVGDLSADLERAARERAERLRQSHQRARSITGEGRLVVEPQLPPDLLGIYVLMPVPGGVQGWSSGLLGQPVHLLAGWGENIITRRRGERGSGSR